MLVFLGIISAIANGFVPYITGRFFDALINVSQHKANFTAYSLPLWAFLLGVWAVIQLVANGIDWTMDRMSRRVDTSIQFKIQTDGFIHLLRLPLQYHKEAHINGVLQKFSNAAWRVSSILSTVINIFPQFLSIVIGITLAATINLELAGILVLGVMLYVALLIKILLPIAAIDSEAHRAWNDGWDNAASTVHQMESVKQAVAEEYETKQVLANLSGRANDLWYKLQIHWSNVGFFQRIIVFFTQLAVFILSVRLVSDGAITVGELVALNGYALMFFGPFVSLGYNWQIIQNGITTAAHAEEIFKEPEEIYVPQGSVSPERILGEVEFQDVSFRYKAEQPEVLTGINFKIKPGDAIAFVGESGVGKSTSISLISGYYFPTKGSVLVDGIDTKKLNLINLRQHIAVVPQEVALFNETIKANIRYGSFDVSDEDMMRVAKEAHIDEFIETLPKRYDTLVGERGVKLSVGQKQRIAIARAMLRDPAILILDEPTSALDAHTEQIVVEALEKLMKGRTTFVIAHRFSTVRKANTILVFQKGRIVEVGTHQELIQREGGIYRHLYEYQVGLH
jgi:ABC-type multidrug transport system fused ATPase/permease subunit